MPNSLKVFHLVWMGSLFDNDSSLISEYKTEDFGFDSQLVNRGQSLLNKWPNNVTVFVQGTKSVDYFLCKGYYSIISDAVRVVIEKNSNGEAEFLPIKVISTLTNQETGQYWILNVINNIVALDWENTIWSTRDVPYSDSRASLSVIKPTVKGALVQGANIFCLLVQGKIMSGIYLSSELKDALEKADCTLGIKFSPVKVS